MAFQQNPEGARCLAVARQGRPMWSLQQPQVGQISVWSKQLLCPHHHGLPQKSLQLTHHLLGSGSHREQKVTPIITCCISWGPDKPAEPESGRLPCYEGTFLGNKLIKASLGGWGKDTEVSTLGVLARDSCQLSTGRAVSAEHRGTDTPGARERVWLGSPAPTNLGVWQAGGKHPGQSF